MALADDIDQFKAALSQKITDEFAEIGAKVDALQAQVAQGQADSAALDALRADVSDAEGRLQSATDELGAQIGDLSTAGDDAPPEEPPAEPPAEPTP